ncbi:isochorismate synthase DhbC [Parasphingorhabdus pacifica]
MTTDSEIRPAGNTEESTAASALDDYRAGDSFFFASPRSAMLARGVEGTVPKVECATRRGLAERVDEFLAGAADFGRSSPMVVGAVPFADDLPAHLVLPGEVVRESPLAAGRVPTPTPARAPDGALRQVPSPDEYQRGVRRALRRMDEDELNKVVLARMLEFSLTEPIDTNAVLRNLAAGDPNGYTFAVDLPVRGEDGSRDSFGPKPRLDRTLMGASPELLVSKHGNRVRSNPMAGSRPRDRNQAEDRRRADELRGSDKDLREHAAVVEAVAEGLRPLCRNLRVPHEPSLTSTAAMWHLSTEITGELRDPDTSSLELATALHPTPAVCGTPVPAARRIITGTEPFERGYYAGMVGWSDSSGDGEWVVAIRCAEAEDEMLRLFAGAGVVHGSDPVEELAETSAKFRTALAAMGLERIL